MSYKSKHAAASIKFTRGAAIVFDKDFSGGESFHSLALLSFSKQHSC